MLSASGLYSACLSVPQRRSISWGKLWGRKKEVNQDGLAQKDIQTAKSRQALIDRLGASQVSRGSIFADEFAEEGRADGDSLGRPRSSSVLGGSLAKEHIARVVDPDPRSRVRWQRKMVIRRVHRNLSVHGRETKAEKIARTERRALSKSPALPTSIKKLMHLARQVSGKTVEDALVQMRFSNKKMAREVRAQLEKARSKAVVQHGMGLGRINGEVLPEGGEVEIQTKDGRWLTINDPTRLYIEQAWVGRGPIRDIKPIYAARGRVFQSKSPSTCKSDSLLLAVGPVGLANMAV